MFCDTFTKSSTSRNGCGEMMYTEGKVCGSGRGAAAVSVPKGGSGLLLVARLCRAARYRMSRTRQSLPPLYERESSSRLECLAVSVLLSCGPLNRGVLCQVACRRRLTCIFAMLRLLSLSSGDSALALLGVSQSLVQRRGMPRVGHEPGRIL